MKKISIALVFVLSLFILTGCDLFAPEEKEFSGSGITITLNEDFVVTQTVIVPLYITSLNDIFMGARENKVDFSGSYIDSLDDYADAVLEMGGHTGETVHESEEGYNYVYAYYSSEVDDVEYGYMLICMESDDYYYVMNLGCLNDDLDDNKEKYIEWANTISVD